MMIRNGKLPHSLTYYSHRALQTSGQEHNSSIILTVLSILICLLARVASLWRLQLRLCRMQHTSFQSCCRVPPPPLLSSSPPSIRQQRHSPNCAVPESGQSGQYDDDNS